MTLGRRHLLQGSMRFGTGALALGLAGTAAPAAAAVATEERLRICRPAGDPLQELLERNGAFCRAWQAAEASGDPQQRVRALLAAWPQHCQVRPEALASGQRPWAAVLGCADSRVPPEWLFACGPGELFEVRSAGNTAFDAGVASLEYAVAELAVPLILVLGHSGCGAVSAALASAPLTPLLEDLVRPIRAALAPGFDLAAAVQANAAATAAALPRRSPLLAEAMAQQRLRIVAATVDIGSGRVRLV